MCESVSTSPPEVISKTVKTASMASAQNKQEKPLAKIIQVWNLQPETVYCRCDSEDELKERPISFCGQPPVIESPQINGE